MKNPKDFNIAIVGVGTMGIGLIQHFASNGHKVAAYDSFAAAIEKAPVQINNNLNTMKNIGEIDDAGIQKTLDNITYYTDLQAAVADADMVIEAVFEDVDIKKDIFKKLETYCREDTILSSNTSTLNIFDIIDIKNPARLVITHFFVPAYAMPLVEIVRGPETSDETADICKEIMVASGKRVAVLNRPILGFIMNRLTFSIFREAAYLVEQGICGPEDVDNAVVAIHGNRYSFEGPFALADFAGVDIYRDISSYLMADLCDSKEVPAALTKLCDEGKLGVKSQEGFYKYGDIAEARAKRDGRILKNIQINKKLDEEFR